MTCNAEGPEGARCAEPEGHEGGHCDPELGIHWLQDSMALAALQAIQAQCTGEVTQVCGLPAGHEGAHKASSELERDTVRERLSREQDKAGQVWVEDVGGLYAAGERMWREVQRLTRERDEAREECERLRRELREITSIAVAWKEHTGADLLPEPTESVDGGDDGV